MKKVIFFFCAVFMAISLLIAFSAVSNIMKARKIETVVSGGYESLLAYENRENSDTFISPEAYVQEKSHHYEREASALYQRAGYELLAGFAVAISGIGVCFTIGKEKKRA